MILRVLVLVVRVLVRVLLLVFRVLLLLLFLRLVVLVVVADEIESDPLLENILNRRTLSKKAKHTKYEYE